MRTDLVEAARDDLWAESRLGFGPARERPTANKDGVKGRSEVEHDVATGCCTVQKVGAPFLRLVCDDAVRLDRAERRGAPPGRAGVRTILRRTSG